MEVGAAQSSEKQAEQTNAGQLLQKFCENGFDGSLSACALVLGRQAEELGDMLHEGAPIDEDLMIKLRAIAQERGIDLEV